MPIVPDSLLSLLASKHSMKDMLILIDEGWQSYQTSTSETGFAGYLNGRNSLVAYDKAAASVSAGNACDVRMSRLSLCDIDLTPESELKILYWEHDAEAIQAALSAHFGDRLKCIANSLQNALGKIRVVLQYTKTNSVGTVDIKEINHIQPMFQMFLTYLNELCGWGGRMVSDARAVDATASFAYSGSPGETFTCSGKLDVLCHTGERDPLSIDPEKQHLIVEMKRPFDQKGMVGCSNGAAAQTMAQCEWMLGEIDNCNIVAACATDMFALAPHLAMKNAKGASVHLIGRRVCKTEEYVNLLLFLCLDHSIDAFESILANSCHTLNAEYLTEFIASDDERTCLGASPTDSVVRDGHCENQPPDGMKLRSGNAYKRSHSELKNECDAKVVFTWDDDDNEAAEEVEHLRRWNERFHGYRVLRESDLLNRTSACDQTMHASY
jgi:hypothetical protein